MALMNLTWLYSEMTFTDIRGWHHPICVFICVCMEHNSDDAIKYFILSLTMLRYPIIIFFHEPDVITWVLAQCVQDTDYLDWNSNSRADKHFEIVESLIAFVHICSLEICNPIALSSLQACKKKSTLGSLWAGPCESCPMWNCLLL